MAIRLLLVGFLLVLIVLSAWKWLSGAYVHRNVTTDKLGPFFETLLVRGLDGGLLVLRPPGKEDERFLQFAKYVRNGERGLQFAFPDSPWSRHLYCDMKRLLDSLGVPVFERSTDTSATPSFLLVDLNEDVETAERIAKAAIAEIFELPEGVGMRATLQDISPKSAGPP